MSLPNDVPGDGTDPNVLPGGFPQLPLPLRWKTLARLWYRWKAVYRRYRIRPLPTLLLGPQYRRSRDLIEIDITYRCNLRCINCNRSIARAPEDLDLPFEKVAEFVEDSLRRGIRWRRIRLLGGEPTAHPDFLRIVELLRGYRSRGNPCSIEVVTNGYGEDVARVLARVPSDVWIENSRKRPGIQPRFRPFSTAPSDDPDYTDADFSNGCEIMQSCGAGLTPTGYYPCAIAGGIDRIAGERHGRERLPDSSDDMADILEWSCRLCGRFKDGHHLPDFVPLPVLTTEQISPTWERLYGEWNRRRRAAREAARVHGST